jgi:hypothetical protein
MKLRAISVIFDSYSQRTGELASLHSLSVPDTRTFVNPHLDKLRKHSISGDSGEVRHRHTQQETGVKKFMKRAFSLMLLALALPLGAFANSVDFTNWQGTFSGGTAGLSLSGSSLIAINGPSGMITGDLGSLAFSTGALTSGSLQTGGTLAAGGSFVIAGNGTSGIPNGVLFSGSFSGPLTWEMITLADGTHNYALSGAIAGTWFTGQTVYGATVQLTVNTGHAFFNAPITFSSGDSNLTGNGLQFISAPEPSSMLLFGTGILGIAGLLRLKSNNKQDFHS